jgi:hypothetical protein
MFRTNDSRSAKRIAYVLGLLSIFSLFVTAWVLIHIRREQEIVTTLVEHLKGGDLEVATELSSDLRL